MLTTEVERAIAEGDRYLAARRRQGDAWHGPPASDLLALSLSLACGALAATLWGDWHWGWSAATAAGAIAAAAPAVAAGAFAVRARAARRRARHHLVRILGGVGAADDHELIDRAYEVVPEPRRDRFVAAFPECSRLDRSWRIARDPGQFLRYRRSQCQGEPEADLVAVLAGIGQTSRELLDTVVGHIGAEDRDVAHAAFEAVRRVAPERIEAQVILEHLRRRPDRSLVSFALERASSDGELAYALGDVLTRWARRGNAQVIEAMDTLGVRLRQLRTHDWRPTRYAVEQLLSHGTADALDVVAGLAVDGPDAEARRCAFDTMVASPTPHVWDAIDGEVVLERLKASPTSELVWLAAQRDLPGVDQALGAVARTGRGPVVDAAIATLVRLERPDAVRVLASLDAVLAACSTCGGTRGSRVEPPCECAEIEADPWSHIPYGPSCPRCDADPSSWEWSPCGACAGSGHRRAPARRLWGPLSRARRTRDQILKVGATGTCAICGVRVDNPAVALGCHLCPRCKRGSVPTARSFVTATHAGVVLEPAVVREVTRDHAPRWRGGDEYWDLATIFPGRFEVSARSGAGPSWLATLRVHGAVAALLGAGYAVGLDGDGLTIERSRRSGPRHVAHRDLLLLARHLERWTAGRTPAADDPALRVELSVEGADVCARHRWSRHGFPATRWPRFVAGAEERRARTGDARFDALASAGRLDQPHEVAMLGAHGRVAIGRFLGGAAASFRGGFDDEGLHARTPAQGPEIAARVEAMVLACSEVASLALRAVADPLPGLLDIARTEQAQPLQARAVACILGLRGTRRAAVRRIPDLDELIDRAGDHLPEGGLAVATGEGGSSLADSPDGWLSLPE